MIILIDDRVLGARELEHVCLNVRVEGQGHTFANLIVNASKYLSQIASCVNTNIKYILLKSTTFNVFDALLNMRIRKNNVSELWASI